MSSRDTTTKNRGSIITNQMVQPAVRSRGYWVLFSFLDHFGNFISFFGIFFHFWNFIPFWEFYSIFGILFHFRNFIPFFGIFLQWNYSNLGFHFRISTFLAPLSRFYINTGGFSKFCQKKIFWKKVWRKRALWCNLLVSLSGLQLTRDRVYPSSNSNSFLLFENFGIFF